MQSTSHHGTSTVEDRTREPSFHAEKTSPGEDVNQRSASDGASEQPWQPRFDRRHSWSQEDRKHELQGRLLRVGQDRETGFSETNGN
ncbi:hypothetical protein N7492_000754 [Penicillium capsulatum]|uniref:Uncharacterized protein n=1 Tax=Penicillium capsulatum TaxID=69766 RepID=A0A9W9IRV3_9EURO|nr:hypothetical protein N7492_000754 [Penicillium capsulatum]KAJ6130187.1 hypothetical protein N7512_002967 [Penicillium capsulatum]